MFQKSAINYQIQKDYLFDKGFITIDKFINIGMVNEIRNNIDNLIKASKEEDIGARIYKDCSNNVIVINRIELADLYFYDLARHQSILEYGQELLGKPLVPLSVELFSKPPKSDLITPAHQDQIFYEDHFNDELAITFWIALDDVHEGNGVLEYSTPKELILLPHRPSESPGFSFELFPDSINKLPQFQKAFVPRGGCVIHHAYAVHRAKGNYTDNVRHALALTYRTSSYKAAFQV